MSTFDDKQKSEERSDNEIPSSKYIQENFRDRDLLRSYRKNYQVVNSDEADKKTQQQQTIPASLQTQQGQQMHISKAHGLSASGTIPLRRLTSTSPDAALTVTSPSPLRRSSSSEQLIKKFATNTRPESATVNQPIMNQETRQVSVSSLTEKDALPKRYFKKRFTYEEDVAPNKAVDVDNGNVAKLGQEQGAAAAQQQGQTKSDIFVRRNFFVNNQDVMTKEEREAKEKAEKARKEERERHEKEWRDFNLGVTQKPPTSFVELAKQKDKGVVYEKARVDLSCVKGKKVVDGKPESAIVVVSGKQCTTQQGRRLMTESMQKKKQEEEMQRQRQQPQTTPTTPATLPTPGTLQPQQQQQQQQQQQALATLPQQRRSPSSAAASEASESMDESSMSEQTRSIVRGASSTAQQTSFATPTTLLKIQRANYKKYKYIVYEKVRMTAYQYGLVSRNEEFNIATAAAKLLIVQLPENIRNNVWDQLFGSRFGGASRICFDKLYKPKFWDVFFEKVFISACVDLDTEIVEFDDNVKEKMRIFVRFGKELLGQFGIGIDYWFRLFFIQHLRNQNLDEIIGSVAWTQRLNIKTLQQKNDLLDFLRARGSNPMATEISEWTLLLSEILVALKPDPATVELEKQEEKQRAEMLKKQREAQEKRAAERQDAARRGVPVEAGGVPMKSLVTPDGLPPSQPQQPAPGITFTPTTTTPARQPGQVAPVPQQPQLQPQPVVVTQPPRQQPQQPQFQPRFQPQVQPPLQPQLQPQPQPQPPLQPTFRPTPVQQPPPTVVQQQPGRQVPFTRQPQPSFPPQQPVPQPQPLRPAFPSPAFGAVDTSAAAEKQRQEQQFLERQKQESDRLFEQQLSEVTRLQAQQDQATQQLLARHTRELESEQDPKKFNQIRTRQDREIRQLKQEQDQAVTDLRQRQSEALQEFQLRQERANIERQQRVQVDDMRQRHTQERRALDQQQAFESQQVRDPQERALVQQTQTQQRTALEASQRSELARLEDRNRFKLSQLEEALQFRKRQAKQLTDLRTEQRNALRQQEQQRQQQQQQQQQPRKDLSPSEMQKIMREQQRQVDRLEREQEKELREFERAQQQAETDFELKQQAQVVVERQNRELAEVRQRHLRDTQELRQRQSQDFRTVRNPSELQRLQRQHERDTRSLENDQRRELENLLRQQERERERLERTRSRSASRSRSRSPEPLSKNENDTKKRQQELEKQQQKEQKEREKQQKEREKQQQKEQKEREKQQKEREKQQEKERKEREKQQQTVSEEVAPQHQEQQQQLQDNGEAFTQVVGRRQKKQKAVSSKENRLFLDDESTTTTLDSESEKESSVQSRSMFTEKFTLPKQAKQKKSQVHKEQTSSQLQKTPVAIDRNVETSKSTPIQSQHVLPVSSASASMLTPVQATPVVSAQSQVPLRYVSPPVYVYDQTTGQYCLSNYVPADYQPMYVNEPSLAPITTVNYVPTNVNENRAQFENTQQSLAIKTDQQVSVNTNTLVAQKPTYLAALQNTIAPSFVTSPQQPQITSSTGSQMSKVLQPIGEQVRAYVKTLRAQSSAEQCDKFIANETVAKFSSDVQLPTFIKSNNAAKQWLITALNSNDECLVEHMGQQYLSSKKMNVDALVKYAHAQRGTAGSVSSSSSAQHRTVIASPQNPADWHSILELFDHIESRDSSNSNALTLSLHELEEFKPIEEFYQFVKTELPSRLSNWSDIDKIKHYLTIYTDSVDATATDNTRGGLSKYWQRNWKAAGWDLKPHVAAHIQKFLLEHPIIEERTKQLLFSIILLKK